MYLYFLESQCHTCLGRAVSCDPKNDRCCSYCVTGINLCKWNEKNVVGWEKVL